jgi:mannose-6-phosphate isomerase-like protein (cupin superfamily)
VSHKNYLVAQLEQIEPIRCPCGFTRRAFAIPENQTATMHLLQLSEDAQVHYHKRLTEIYLILEGSGHLELDGEQVPVQPMTSILIRPGCRHRAVGNMRIIIVAIPRFDPADEWFD